MSEPFLAEIRMVGFNFAPRGWAFCDGQLLPINQNQALYSLLGTTFGGDGRTDFALPDLRGRVPAHKGDDLAMGERSGPETVTLTAQEMPCHTHTFSPSSAPGNRIHPGAGNVRTFGSTTEPQNYGLPTNLVAMNKGTNSVGGGQSHNNMQPSLAIGFCIALQGLFPSRN